MFRLKENRIFKQELIRKSFHILIGSLLILSYLILGKIISIIIYSIFLFLSILSDIIRIRIYISYPLKRIAETLARSYERTSVGAHTYFFGGILVAAILFEETAFITAAFVVTLIDPLITLSGLTFNKLRHPYNKTKSIIGTIIGCLVLFLFGKFIMEFDIYLLILLLILVYTIDSIPIPINDNLLYPFSIGLITEIFQFLQ